MGTIFEPSTWGYWTGTTAHPAALPEMTGPAHRYWIAPPWGLMYDTGPGGTYIAPRPGARPATDDEIWAYIGPGAIRPAA